MSGWTREERAEFFAKQWREDKSLWAAIPLTQADERRVAAILEALNVDD